MGILSLIFALLANPAFAKTVHYELKIERKSMNMSGKKTVDYALAVNGGIPGPTLEFTEGDDAEIVVQNNLEDEEASVHWHGVLLPNIEDGVPYVSTPPIHPGMSRTFRFRVRQHGTYWYHSHTNIQEQKGVFGAIVFHPKTEKIAADREAVAVLSDWSDEDGEQILRNLRKDGDYYLYKKNTVRSYFGAWSASALGAQLKNEWQRMGGMDLSDVGYDAFLINGKRDSQLLMAHPGQRVRIRLINAGSSSYFYVSLGGLPFQVVAADGIDIDPVRTNEILLGMAETYDILFTVPEHKNYELRATAQDVTGHASAWIGMNEKVFATDKPVPNLYMAMDHSAHGGHAGHGEHANHSAASASEAAPAHDMAGMDHSQMDHSKMDHSKMKMDGEKESKIRFVETLTVDEVRAASSTALPKSAPVHDLKLVLGGDMSRYIWFINGKAIFQDQEIQVKEGEAVRFTLENETMMHHPMHLHGHFFRVLNQFGDWSPLKHTVDVPPHSTRVIEFYANEPGAWMLHCHNLYHMHSGMARVVKYMSFVPSPEVSMHGKHDPHLHDHIYWDGSVEAASNHGKASFRLSKTWDTLELKGETREEKGGHWEFEGDLFYRRWLSQYFNVVAGGTSFGEHQRAAVGASYMLPLMLEVQALIDHKGDLRGDLHRRFQWTGKIFTDAEFTFRQHEKTEFEISLMYGPSWHWAAGLMVTEDRLGAGAQFRF